MKIELIAVNDIERVKSLIQLSFIESVAPTWSENAIEVFLKEDLSIAKLALFISGRNICIKAIDDDEIVGVLIFSSESKLAHLFVLPSSYGRGIARLLFGSALKLVNENVEYISLTSTEIAKKVKA